VTDESDVADLSSLVAIRDFSNKYVVGLCIQLKLTKCHLINASQKSCAIVSCNRVMTVGKLFDEMTQMAEVRIHRVAQ